MQLADNIVTGLCSSGHKEIRKREREREREREGGERERERQYARKSFQPGSRILGHCDVLWRLMQNRWGEAAERADRRRRHVERMVSSPAFRPRC